MQLPKLCLLLVVVTLLLWAVINLALFCDLTTVEGPVDGVTTAVPLREGGIQRGAAHGDVEGGVEDVVKWFTAHVAHSRTEATLPYSACPQLNISDDLLTTLTAIGDLQPPLTDTNQNSKIELNLLLGDVVPFLQGTDTVVTTFSSALPSKSGPYATEILRSLRSLGVRLVSLANDHVRQHGDGGSEAVLHAVEDADIRWLGLNAKHHEIIIAGGEKVGFLAFCGVHGECMESSSIPFAPLKFSAKTAGKAVNELKERGVRAIIVLMYWGRENSYFPDETALTIARQLARLEVSLVVGHHPFMVQDHAYFGRTLVLFSLGKLITTSDTTSFCWQETLSHEWKYSDAHHCRMVHPALRDSTFEAEQQTRVYKIMISRSGAATSEYATIPIVPDPDLPWIRRPLIAQTTFTEWTLACGESDHHCLACKSF